MRKTICEFCSNCETEVVIEWDVEKQGYKTFCPVCGERLMLCDECQHRNDGEFTDDCDYDSITDTCRFNKENKFQPKERKCYTLSFHGYDGDSGVAVFWNKSDAHKAAMEEAQVEIANLTNEGYAFNVTENSFGVNLYVPDSGIYFEWNIEENFIK